MSASTDTLVCMRTTLNLPDGLVELAKARARETGRTFTSLVEEGLWRVLQADPDPDPPAEPFRLPTSGDPNGTPLIDLDDKDALWAELDRDGFK